MQKIQQGTFLVHISSISRAYHDVCCEATTKNVHHRHHDRHHDRHPFLLGCSENSETADARQSSVAYLNNSHHEELGNLLVEVVVLLFAQESADVEEQNRVGKLRDLGMRLNEIVGAAVHSHWQPQERLEHDTVGVTPRRVRGPQRH